MLFFYGWWMVIACASIVLFGGAFFYSFSAPVDPLEDEFGWKRALIAVGMSACSGPVSQMTVARWFAKEGGPRYGHNEWLL